MFFNVINNMLYLKLTVVINVSIKTRAIKPF